MTRDLISNEIFRRVSENGRTMGEYIREILNPLCEIELVCGANEEELEKIFDYTVQGKWSTMKAIWQGPTKVPVGLSVKSSLQFIKRL
jgi:hypothetical protein